MFISRTQRRGFTLVELLIILGVMSALSTIVYYNVNEARAKSRDTQRMSDLSQIHLALRLYNDTYGSYPDFPGAVGGVAVGEGTEIDAYLDPFFPRSFKDPLASTGDRTTTMCTILISTHVISRQKVCMRQWKLRHMQIGQKYVVPVRVASLCQIPTLC